MNTSITVSTELFSIMDEIKKEVKPTPTRGRKPKAPKPADPLLKDRRPNYCPHCNTFLSIKHYVPVVIHIVVSTGIDTKIVGASGKECLYCHVEEA